MNIQPIGSNSADVQNPFIHQATTGLQNQVTVSSSQLFSAISQSNVAALKVLLAQPSVDLSDHNALGQTPLHMAVDSGNYEMVAAIIKSGHLPNIDIADKNGETGLMYVAKTHHLNMMDLLVNAKANVNATAENGNTVLMIAAEKNNKDMMKKLLDAGADANAVNKNNGNTALMITAQKLSSSTAALLLQYKADVNAKNLNEETPLMMAAGNNCINIVTAFLDAGAHVNTVNKNGDSALRITMQKNKIGMANGVINALLEAGAEVNATKDDETRLLTTLGTTRQSINTPCNDGQTPMQHAAIWGHTGIVQFLLKTGADVDATPSSDALTPLALATYNGQATTIKVLLAAGANVNTKIPHDGTVLNIAMREERTDIVELLLKAGATQ